MAAWSLQLRELKHSIKLYLASAGGVTKEMAAIGLKLVDVLDDIEAGRSPHQDLTELSTALIKSLFETVRDRLLLLHDNRAYEYHHILVEAQSIIKDYPITELATKNHYLRLLAKAYKYLEELTGNQYGPVTDVLGRVL